MRKAGHKTVRWLTAATVAAATAVLAPVGATSATASDPTFSQPEPIVMTDADGTVPFPSLLYVYGVDGQVFDVDITLGGVTHGWPADVDVVLVAPDGTAATVMSDLGGDDQTPATGGTLVFDDDATGTAPLGLASGRYLPQDDDSDSEDVDLEDADATLDDLASSAYINGTWQLFVFDDTYDFEGSIDSWSLTFKIADPPVIVSPAPAAVIAGSTLPVRGTGTPGAQVYVTLDQQAARTVTVAPDGSWSTDFAGLGDGNHTVAAAGTPSGAAAASITVRLDSTPPTGTLRLRTVRGGPELTSSTRVWLVLGASERLRGVRVSNDGAPLGALLPTSSQDVAWRLGGHDGTRRVFVQLEDLAGNLSQGLLTDTVRLDRVAPRVSSTSPASGAVGVRRTKVVSAHFDDFVTPNPGAGISYLARIFRVGSDRPVRATARYDTSTATVRILPRKLLRPGTRYKVVIRSGFYDKAGNALDQNPAKRGGQPKVWRFTTR
jgi:hypothetical protein